MNDDAAIAALIRMTETTLTEQQIAALTGTDMATNQFQPPRRSVMTPGTIPEDLPNEERSVTRIKELVPVRVATQRVLDGPWSGAPLTAHRIIGSNFGGKHFILQLGHMAKVGDADSFRLVFVVRLPIEGKEPFDDPELLADAARTAEGMLSMLNLRRMKEPAAPSFAGTAENINAAIMRATAIPGRKPVV